MLIDEQGYVAAIGPDVGGEVPTPPGVPTEYFPDAALLPGLINAHTHLELTGLAPQLDEPDFPSWIRRLRALKAERTPEQFLEAARQGIRECWAAGVTTVADTGDTGAVARALAELGGRGVAYQEVFGPHPAQVEESMTGLKAAVAALRPLEVPGRLRIGVSPHAPYTVSGAAVPRGGEVGSRGGAPARGPSRRVGGRVAASCATAPVASPMPGRSAGFPAPEPLGMSPVAFVDHHMGLVDTLCIHAVRVDAADIDLLFRRGRIGRALSPVQPRASAWRRAARGDARGEDPRRVSGTDSVLSVGRARPARGGARGPGPGRSQRLRHAGDGLPGMPPAPSASGTSSACWSWVRQADVAVVSMPHDTPEPEEELLSGRGTVLATFVGGREVYRRGNG